MTSLPLTQDELQEEVSSLSSTQLTNLKEAAKNDLFVMARGVLGYEAVNKNTHGAMCNFMVHGQKVRRLTLYPRGHFKSTIDTISDSVRLSCKDPDHTRILLVNETATNAEGFLSEIKSHWENNQLLRKLFPELVPRQTTGPGAKWSSTMATLNRSTAYKEGTYTAIGVGGAVTSRHYTNIKCDDLIGLEADRSPAEMRAAISWVDQIEPLLTSPDDDVIDFIGTRWSQVDLYAHLIQGYSDDLETFSRMATDTGEPDGEPIFPERFSRERFERIKRINPKQWYAQYCNNPIAEGNRDFDPGQIRYYRWNTKGEIEFKDGATIKTWSLESLYITIMVDPNSGAKDAPDTAAIVATGVSPDDEVFVLSSYSGRPDPGQLLELIYDTACRWSPAMIGIEKAGQQTTLWQFDQLMRRRSRSFRVEPLHHKNIEKEKRIRDTVQPLLGLGHLFLTEQMIVLRNSITNFPQITLWDELDALAYGPSIWRSGSGVIDLAEARENINKIITARGRTGYGGYSVHPRRLIRRRSA